MLFGLPFAPTLLLGPWLILVAVLAGGSGASLAAPAVAPAAPGDRFILFLTADGFRTDSDHGMSAFEAKQAGIEPARALAGAGFRVARSEAELNAETQIVVLDTS